MKCLTYSCLICHQSILGLQASLSSKGHSSGALNIYRKGSLFPAVRLLDETQTSSKLYSSRSLTLSYPGISSTSTSNILSGGSLTKIPKLDNDVEVLIHLPDCNSNTSLNSCLKDSLISIRKTVESQSRAVNKSQYGTYLHVPGFRPVASVEELRCRSFCEKRKTGSSNSIGQPGFSRNSFEASDGPSRESFSDEESRCLGGKSVYVFSEAMVSTLLIKHNCHRIFGILT